MKHKTLIILSPGFAANEADTACIPALQQFVIQLKQLRPELLIKVFALHYPFKEGKYMWNGVECYSFGGKNKRGIHAWYLRKKARKHLNELCKRGDVQGILSIWMSDCALIGQELMKEFKTPHFCWMHGQDARMGNKHVKNIHPKPQQIIAISDLLQKEFENNYGIRAEHVIENGITENLFPKFNTEHRPIDVIGVGSLTPLKNYSHFIDVIAELKKEFPSINAMIIGEGLEKEMLQQKIDKRKLASNLKLMGSMPHQEVLKYLSKSKILLHTSTYEGSSGVIMEVLYSGCFVVTRISVSLDLVKNIELAANVSEMRRKIELMLKNSELKHERVIYNTMKHSTEKIISIFGL
ncbi:MAG: glycosyltransferase family 4 protein [Bacteroidota bacterium]|nr:glycosyltransferase family 4 protein [Bacteroidota bacterium]